MTSLKNTRIEFHILQSFPVTCLNRDDVGAPKSAMIGGVPRARVSSQCWKRQVRLQLKNYDVVTGTRTKLISELVASECMELGATEEQAKNCGDWLEGAFIKLKSDKKKKTKSIEEDENESKEESSDTLLFLAPDEIKKIAKTFADNGFDAIKTLKATEQKKRAKEVASLIDKSEMNAFDIALFGRMVAQATSLNVEAACSFSHAISTHKVVSEIEFFTAVDDDPLNIREDTGSAHMGSLEYNSATYYRYISLDLGQLQQTMGTDADLKPAIEAFVKALYVAVPSARQTTQAGACPWEFSRVLVRKGQGLQASFEQPVKAKGQGYLVASKAALNEWLDAKEKLSGSLFGKLADFQWGENLDYSIDHLIADLQAQL
ncbi:CRISPR-associated protein, Cse4 family [Oceanospirillum multiglobuliferum]|uniref:Type I-E CRISPR-associated protein Cas7/Cse4/CasC n=1 Tax=Oceanospirillum multiglobuliferum TaxID=64969 RepID=A0A1T4MN21_9GAMM|nr:type I-E CRISPR-associated protein Cas7/Cse4/CasC [Oceanospirillum multiglobuliferum]OPX56960.1 type I-E CRISPR-associated protein Cas7/Cse4/CasC [Oceanospirillum multiglobuliferum]SJZ68271.1 CRISPR-associated protein, Cse4 family [Oceanospirillum multiglobuliferum]